VYAYFSPSAAVWAQGIIEAIFGLKADRTRGMMTIAPCMPDEWDHASLVLPGIIIDFRRNGSTQCYSCSFSTDEERTFLLRLPPYASCRAKLNGREVETHSEKHLGWFELSVPVGTCRTFTVEIDCAALEYALDYPKCLAEGSAFTISVKDARILSVSDPSGLLSGSARTDASSLSLTLRGDLLVPYEKFGWFGLVNFARRSLVVTLQAKGVEHTVPVHLVVVPPVAAEGHYDGKELSVTLDNNTGFAITGQIACHFYGKFLPLPGDSLPTGRTVLSLSLDQAQRDRMVLGKNTATLLFHEKMLEFDIEFDFTAYEALPLTLPEERLVPATCWKDMCGKQGMQRTHMFNDTPYYFMDGLFETQHAVDILPGLPVLLNKAGFLPLDSEKYRYVTLDLSGIRARKLYLLVSGFITQHNLWSRYHTTEVCDTVFNLIEIDLQKTRSLKELRVIVTAAETSGGIYAISSL